MQRVGVKRHVAVMVQPVPVAEVRDVDDQRIALPMTHGVAMIAGHDVVAMRPSVGRDNPEAVVGLDELNDRLRRLHDLADQSVADERRRTDDARDAPERGIVLVTERLRLGHRFGLVETSE